MKTEKLLEEITMIDGPSGFEGDVARYMKSKFEGLCDEVIYDNLGSIFAVKKSRKQGAPKIMVAAHMDEVGFMITGYTKEGLLRIHPLGGWWSQTLLSSRVNVYNNSGKQFVGMVSSISTHLLTPEDLAKPYELSKMLIDCGFESEEEAKANIEIGSFATPRVTFEKLTENRYLSKAFDDRVGCAMGIEILEALKDVELDCDLYVGATVQEEVGSRGAIVSSNLIKPDFFIALEAAPAKDTAPSNEVGHLGNGPLIRIKDARLITNPNIVKYVTKLADENELKYQYYTSAGSTDASVVSISNEGVPSIVMCIAARSIHSHSSIIDRRDYNGCKLLATQLIKSLNKEVIEELK